MKCQSCGKREATVRYYENINGKKQELHLCLECSNKLGFNNFADIFSPLFVDNFSEFELTQNKCRNCGYTLDDYSKTGLFGCPECYNQFKDDLDELFLKIQGKNRHVLLDNKNGKSEEKSEVKTKRKVLTKEEKIQKYKDEIKECIENEDYEKAAVLRDKIKKIEGND